MYGTPTNTRSRERVRPHWVYRTQLYTTLQEAIFAIRTCDHKVTRQQLYRCTKTPLPNYYDNQNKTLQLLNPKKYKRNPITSKS